MSDRLRASLIGGALMGVLSVLTLLPPLPFIRLLCCLWAIVGGVVAAYLYVKRSPRQVSVGGGAIVGLLTGAFGAILPLGAFLLVSFYVPEARVMTEEALRRYNLKVSYPFIILLTAWMALVLQLAQALVGGIIGVAIFEQRGDDNSGPPPPPPPSYPYTGGAPGEAYAPPPAPPAD